jgi:hypothetical protein
MPLFHARGRDMLLQLARMSKLRVVNDGASSLQFIYAMHLHSHIPYHFSRRNACRSPPNIADA